MQFHQFKQIKYLQVKTRFHSSSNKLVFKKGRKRKRDREREIFCKCNAKCHQEFCIINSLYAAYKGINLYNLAG